MAGMRREKPVLCVAIWKDERVGQHVQHLPCRAVVAAVPDHDIGVAVERPEHAMTTRGHRAHDFQALRPTACPLARTSPQSASPACDPGRSRHRLRERDHAVGGW